MSPPTLNEIINDCVDQQKLDRKLAPVRKKLLRPDDLVFSTEMVEDEHSLKQQLSQSDGCGTGTFDKCIEYDLELLKKIFECCHWNCKNLFDIFYKQQLVVFDKVLTPLMSRFPTRFLCATPLHCCLCFKKVGLNVIFIALEMLQMKMVA